MPLPHSDRGPEGDVMVDTNPARGMPLALQRYWLAGKGAAKIRWNTVGDFLRCVRHLAKYFPKDPKGLCNILHTKATGGPPGHGSLEIATHHHAITAATALLAAQPMLGPNVWSGPMAPVGRLTQEPNRKRIFEHGAIKSRTLPLPIRYQKNALPGHTGAVTVARILGNTVGPDENGKDTVYGWGDWLDPAIVPEVTEAKYMVDQGMAGLSLDPGGPVNVTVDPNTGIEHTTEYTMGGATLVAIPAFDSMRIYNMDGDGNWNMDDPDMDMSMDEEGPDCGCMAEDTTATEPPNAPLQPALTAEYAVNSSGWHGLPLAPRDAVFDNDDAVQRITQWAGNDPAKLNQAFMWRDSTQPPAAAQSYRLPFGDIINGKLTLVFHAIYAAAALISGAHGGLPGISEEDKNQLRNTISAIYPEMAKAFNDPNIRAPWDRAAAMEGQHAMTEYAADPTANKPYGDVKYADPGYQSDKKKRYPLDSEEHCRAAWSYINQQDNASKYNPAQLKAVKGRIAAALKKYGVNVNTGDSQYAISDDGYPLEPPSAWFADPKLDKRTPLTVTPEGQVYGHLAAWGVCHRDVGNRECVLAPKSRANYEPYHLGQVYTAEGETIRVGKIVQDTRHAGINLGYSAAALHYDNTGDEVAVVRAGEDAYGIWLAGAVVPEVSRKQVAKLRRSPISGDWRAVNGNLELTAALAVNVPAFPVYSMDNEERLALVAAGMVYSDDSIEEPEVDDNLAEEEDDLSPEQEDRAWELREILEREEELLQQQRGAELAQVFAAGQALVTPPAAPPVTGMVPADPNGLPDPSADPFSPAAIAARQLDARFSVISETGGGADHPAPAPKEPVVAPTVAPTAPVPVPAPVPAA
jgi:hypothetical protein